MKCYLGRKLVLDETQFSSGWNAYNTFMREYTFHKKPNLYDTTEHIIKNVLKHWEPKQIYKT
jgi:hypothetical protein